jgi:hypothetical protein
MSDPNQPDRVPDKYRPGIRESDVHTSKQHPDPHRDIDFNQGRLPGQLPLPFPKIHQSEDPNKR